MTLRLTNTEFQQIRGIVQNLKNPTVTNEFNCIFTNAVRGGNSLGSTGYVDQDGMIFIDIPQQTAMKFLLILKEYSPEFGNMLNSNKNVGLMEGSRIMNVFKGFAMKLRLAFSNK